MSKGQIAERYDFQEFKATALLTSNTAKMVTLHYTILAKVCTLLKQLISKSKGSVISTQRMEVALGQTNSMASWKRSGLVELDPKGKGDKGYDGIILISSFLSHCLTLGSRPYIDFCGHHHPCGLQTQHPVWPRCVHGRGLSHNMKHCNAIELFL